MSNCDNKSIKHASSCVPGTHSDNIVIYYTTPHLIPQSQALSSFHDLLAAQVAAEISTGGIGPLILPTPSHTHPNIHSMQDYLNLLNLH